MNTRSSAPLKLFLHGVPDTPSIWDPLILELGLEPDAYRAPALPGFVTPTGDGFASTKDAYAAWCIAEVERAFAECGPVDLVGHDWGAMFTIRVASVRPELVRSWCISNAVIHPDYAWHANARVWQTPLLGELFNLITSQRAVRNILQEEGVPAELAATEASHWAPPMKRAVLRLLRSGKRIGSDWWPETRHLPQRGMVFWGVKDPYTPVEVADTFCEATGTPMQKLEQAGHWAIVEHADVFAAALEAHWA